MKPKITALLAAVLLTALASNVDAQTFSIDWYKIASGGGTSSGGGYQVSGTIGQPDSSSTMTGGSYSFTGGFWSLYALQTPGAPTLFISQSGKTVTVYWQNVPGWNLQQNGNLTQPANWSASGGVNTSNGTNSITINNPTGNLFFRLKQ